jgi:hypothetical protein
MNRRKPPMTPKAAKIQKKAARDVRNAVIAPPEAPPARAKKILIKTSHELDHLKTRFENKRAKLKGKHSRRTTPGYTESFSFAPANANIEGKRWISTVAKQARMKAKILARKLSKR